jgi:hypothetical protein
LNAIRFAPTCALLLLLPLLAACPPPPPPPEAPRAVFGDTGLQARIDGVEAQLTALGGRNDGRWGPFFLSRGQSAQVPLTLAGGSCWLVLGLAGARVGDLDLYIYDLSGRRIDGDEERDAHPVVVKCLAEEAKVVATPLVYDGAGEVFLGLYRFPQDGAPERGAIDFEEVQPLPPPGAETSAEAIARMDRTMLAEGFRPTGDREEIALEERGTIVRSRRIRQGRCLGVALVGGADATDLDLALNLGSRRVAEDRETNRDAHVGWCAESDVDVRVSASTAQGAASGTLIYYDAAPEDRVFVTPSQLPEEPTAEGLAGGPTFEQTVLALDRRMHEGGYEPLDPPVAEGVLAVGEVTMQPLQLSRGSCYEIDGLARPDGIRDLDLMLDDALGNRVAEDRSESNDPRISFCPDVSGSYALQIQAYDGSGGYEVHSYRLGAAAREIPGVAGRLASAYGRVAAELFAKGFHGVGTPDRRPAEADRQNSHPLLLQFGSCYAIVALASGDEMDIDVEVRDYLLRSISVDAGGEADARVFVCPDRTAEYFATVTVARGSGQYMLAVFESKPE